MKYTVVIRQPVEEHVLPQLTQDLTAQFGLSPEQAAKLASRRSGRLMKPTTRKRAETLMAVFQAAGASVALDEVRDDTTLVSDPFAASRPGLVGPASTAGVAVAEAPAQVGLEQAAVADTDAWGAPGWGSLDGPSTLTVAPISPASAGTPLKADALDPAALPASPFAAEIDAFPVFGLQGSEGVILPLDPVEPVPMFVQHDGEPTVPQVVPSHVPEMNLVGSGAASTPQPAADDAWADFTGSLGSAPATDAVSDSAASEQAANTLMTVDTGLEPAKTTRRSSLLRRVLTSALLPLGLFTLLTLGFLLYALPRSQRQLIAENAQAVAVAVGGNLEVTNQDTVTSQLDALLNRSSVGFVQVNLPDGTSFFRGKNASTDGPLSEQVAAWVQQHPTDSTFTQSGSAADSFRYQLKQLEDVGAGDSEQAKQLKAQATDPANQASSTATYVLSSVNVAQSAAGVRTVVDSKKRRTEGGTSLYSVVVGVPADSAFAELRNLLLLVLGVALVAFLVAAMLAARTARLLVQPIERLVRAADAISMGDLERPVAVERNDEIGDLAQALERMRLSLEAAMGRLRRRRKGA